MHVETIAHPSGDQLPILLDGDGLPVPSPNEFVLSRRNLATNTLVRDLRILQILYRWLDQHGVDLEERIKTAQGFSEAEIRGSLVEKLRRDQTKNRNVTKIAVCPDTFNLRLTTLGQYIGWLFDVHIATLPLNDFKYERLVEQKTRILKWLNNSSINAPPSNKSGQKGLSEQQSSYLVSCLDPDNPDAIGRNPAVRFRNYVSVMIMLNYGLRPGELLSLRVEDIEFGGISGIRVTRRPPDPQDKRRPRPSIKRNGRVLPIDNPAFSRRLDEYIMKWREILETKSEESSEYLIISDEGAPLSQSSLTQLFEDLRERFPDSLPSNLTPRALRHTFSCRMEATLRNNGMDEERRRQALAWVRGDSSLESQNVYIAQEIEEQARIALEKYHRSLLGEAL
ncbi:tyrosine-type recombinase/integrase [Phormidium tenue]|uniref:Integrase n=1 Tax=Phormidium tenue NIES-30 TaxID=549789 RepID=A0A1U7J5L1_9CYAN|nr:site-specific integrase [Phormidium tenue]MBD2232529.1 site-specific integrase [Phormidium tenue FACHB-1052]OKH47992.1 integrase [Phormidium tenue NIES-30]